MSTHPETPLHKVAEQMTNNSTGWIGEVPGNDEHLVKGQTFIANEEGDIQAIRVFPNMIAKDSNVYITLHQFDPNNESWGQVLSSANIELKHADAGKWVSFDIHGAHLQKGKSYGFRLDTKNSYIGIGEACSSSKQPVFKSGKEWQFTPGNPTGDSYTYLSLAFKVVAA